MKVKYYFFILLLLATSACKNNLEEDLVGEIKEEINIPPLYPQTACGCGPNLIGGYGLLRTTGTASHGGYFTLQEVTSDEMVITQKGSDWSNDGAYIALHQHTYQPDHAFLNITWVHTYDAINHLNDLMDNNPSLEATEVAQAKVLRAFFYLRLLDLFGNVQLVTSPQEDGIQVSRIVLFDFIEAEILSALGITEITENIDLSESLLEDTNNTAYSINRYGTLGILAKLYLNAEVYAGKKYYQEATWISTYIIDSGLYHLCGQGCKVLNLGKRNGVASDPDHLEGYAAVFAPNNENNPEHIFAVLYDELSGLGMNFGQMNLHYGSQASYDLSDQPWNGYSTLKAFYNAYDNEDARKTANFLVGTQLDFGGNAILDYDTDDENIVLNYTPQIDELEPKSKREAGVRAKKFSYKLFGRTNMDNDYPIVRLGEIYLIRAEALARERGDWNQAISDVNLLRARAGVSTYTTLTEREFLAERGREMFHEASRRTDLIRFGQYNSTWWEKPVDPSTHVNIFPIPEAQIQASGGMLRQNPGY